MSDDGVAGSDSGFASDGSVGGRDELPTGPPPPLPPKVKRLTDECWGRVFSFLDAEDLETVSKVSQQFADVAFDHRAWLYAAQRLLPNHPAGYRDLDDNLRVNRACATVKKTLGARQSIAKGESTQKWIGWGYTGKVVTTTLREATSVTSEQFVVITCSGGGNTDGGFMSEAYSEVLVFDMLSGVCNQRVGVNDEVVSAVVAGNNIMLGNADGRGLVVSLTSGKIVERLDTTGGGGGDDAAFAALQNVGSTWSGPATGTAWPGTGESVWSGGATSSGWAAFDDVDDEFWPGTHQATGMQLSDDDDVAEYIAQSEPLIANEGLIVEDITDVDVEAAFDHPLSHSFVVESPTAACGGEGEGESDPFMGHAEARLPDNADDDDEQQEEESVGSEYSCETEQQESEDGDGEAADEGEAANDDNNAAGGESDGDEEMEPGKFANASMWCVCAADDNQVLGGMADGSILVWCIGSPNWPREVEHHRDQVTALSVSSTGLMAVSGDYCGHVYMWDFATGAIKHTCKNAHDGPVVGAIFTSSDTVVITGSGKNITAWDADTGVVAMRLEVPQEITCLVTSPDGMRVAAGHADGFHLWDMWEGDDADDERKNVSTPAGVVSITIGDDNLIICLENGEVRFYNKELDEYSIVGGESTAVAAATYLPVSRDAITSEVASESEPAHDDNRITVWRKESCHRRFHVVRTLASCLAADSAGRVFVTGGLRCVEARNAATGHLVSRAEWQVESGDVELDSDESSDDAVVDGEPVVSGVGAASITDPGVVLSLSVGKHVSGVEVFAAASAHSFVVGVVGGCGGGLSGVDGAIERSLDELSDDDSDFEWAEGMTIDGTVLGGVEPETLTAVPLPDRRDTITSVAVVPNTCYVAVGYASSASVGGVYLAKVSFPSKAGSASDGDKEGEGGTPTTATATATASELPTVTIVGSAWPTNTAPIVVSASPDGTEVISIASKFAEVFSTKLLAAAVVADADDAAEDPRKGRIALDFFSSSDEVPRTAAVSADGESLFVAWPYTVKVWPLKSGLPYESLLASEYAVEDVVGLVPSAEATALGLRKSNAGFLEVLDFTPGEGGDDDDSFYAFHSSDEDSGGWGGMGGDVNAAFQVFEMASFHDSFL